MKESGNQYTSANGVCQFYDTGFLRYAKHSTPNEECTNKEMDGRGREMNWFGRLLDGVGAVSSKQLRLRVHIQFPVDALAMLAYCFKRNAETGGDFLTDKSFGEQQNYFSFAGRKAIAFLQR
jgi:hypothetical protein